MIILFGSINPVMVQVRGVENIRPYGTFLKLYFLSSILNKLNFVEILFLSNNTREYSKEYNLGIREISVGHFNCSESLEILNQFKCSH